MYCIYSVLYSLAVFVLLIPQYLKRPAGLRRRWLREKFGQVSGLADAGGKRPFWIHAVSVGEVTAAIPFLEKMQNAYPERPLVLSTMTDTGQNLALSKVPEGVRVIYMPFDSVCVMRRFFDRLAPALFVVVETEIWPNVIRLAHDKGIPVIMVNGRISGRSFRGYRRIRGFMKKVLGSVTLFLMQTADDAERIHLLGAAADKVLVSGSFKFDIPDLREIPSWASGIEGPIIVAGSTHAGEEVLMIEALKRNLGQFPALKLILAPRHPERFHEVEEAVSASGLSYIRRTSIPDTGGPVESGVNVVILDSIGELSAVYGSADIAVIGKSFTSAGGQNPLEPAMWGKAIICGPHMENFPFIAEFYREGAAFEVPAEGLADKIGELLRDVKKGEAAGQKARALYTRNAGAVGRVVETLKKYIR